MSFGFSRIDFITVIQLSKKVRKQFVDAPKEFSELQKEWVNSAVVQNRLLINFFSRIKGLSNVLRDLEDLEDVLSVQELSSEQKESLEDAKQGCTEVLLDLNKVAEKYSELDKASKKFDDRIRRVWKRLKWEPQDVQQLRSRLTSNITLLNTIQNSLLRCDQIFLSALTCC